MQYYTKTETDATPSSSLPLILKITPVTGMMLAVAAVAAGAAFADVQSSNIVGYRGEDCTEPRYVSVKFWQVGNAGAECSLTDVIDTSLVGIGDTIDVYNADEHCDFTFMWYGEDYGFMDIDMNPLALEVVPGVSFLATGSDVWNFVGEVPQMTTYDHVIDGPTYIGNAFPTDATYADFDWAGALQIGDTIDVYNADEHCDFTFMWYGEDYGFMDIDMNPLDMDAPAEGALAVTDADTITQTFPGYVAD